MMPSFARCSLGGHPGGLPTLLHSLKLLLEWIVAAALTLFVINVFTNKHPARV